MTRTVSRKCRLSVVLLILSLPVPAIASDTLPAGDDVNDAAKKARQISDSFFLQTFKIRMRYEYAGSFADPNDKITIRALATKASDDLEQIANDQDALKKQIENYEGDDWESRFGETGLWRKLAADLLKTQISKLEIDYYIARVDGKFQSQAEQQFFKLRAKSDLSQCESLKTSLEQIKRFGPSEPNNIEDIARSLAKSECKDDREMLLSLAILQRKFAPAELQNTLSRSPQTALLLGKIILADLSTRSNFGSINPADAELAATIALQTNPQPYANLITKLAENDRFQTPAVVYVAANQLNRTNPQKAVQLLIKASNLQLEHPNILLKVTPEEMAKQAFDLAYQAVTENLVDCQQTIDAFQNYSRIAPDKIDEQTQFLYANLLNHCNRTNEAVEVFGRLADGSQSFWHNSAVLELLKIELNKATTPAVLTRLHDFILACARSEEREIQLRREAINIYCETLLNQDSSDCAEKVLNILDAAEPTPGLPYELLRAVASGQLGRLEESIRFMSQAISTNDNSIAPQAVALLSEVLDKAEIWEQQADDFNEMLKNCERLARFAHKSINDQQTALTLAEVSILRDNPDFAHTLLDSLADKNDTNRIRPQARFLTAQGDFSRAALLWAKIAELRRNESPTPDQKSWNWWRAKFYELACLGKLPATNAGDLRHTIEVLQNSYGEIPRPWAEKLAALKEQLQNND